MTGAVSALTGLQLPYPAASYVIVLAALAVAAKVLWTGFDNEAAYASERQAMSQTSFGVEPVALAEGRRVAALEAIRDRASGRSFGIDPEHTLLEIFEGGGLMVAYGCRSGVCGADPIAIVGGQENLIAADPAEQETLRRLGLEGRARMACVCRAKGPVEVDLKADLQALAAASVTRPGSTDTRSADLAAQAGIGRVVIIGNGVAGTTAAELLRRDSPSCRIDLVTRESQHFYNRMALGRVVSSRSGLDGLQLMSAGWFEQRRITVWLNTIANLIDPVRREVHLGTGETLAYDRLILAPGGAAVLPDVPGVRLPGVFVLREAEDAVRLRAWSQMGSRTVSNGGDSRRRVARHARSRRRRRRRPRRGGGLRARRSRASRDDRAQGRPPDEPPARRQGRRHSRALSRGQGRRGLDRRVSQQTGRQGRAAVRAACRWNSDRRSDVRVLRRRAAQYFLGQRGRTEDQDRHRRRRGRCGPLSRISSRLATRPRLRTQGQACGRLAPSMPSGPWPPC